MYTRVSEAKAREPGVGRQHGSAVSFLGDMWRQAVVPDETAYSAAIACCAANGAYEEADALVAEMRRKGLEVREETLAASKR